MITNKERNKEEIYKTIFISKNSIVSGYAKRESGTPF
jgi:hypothetical protein